MPKMLLFLCFFIAFGLCQFQLPSSIVRNISSSVRITFLAALEKLTFKLFFMQESKKHLSCYDYDRMNEMSLRTNLMMEILYPNKLVK